MLLVPVMMLVGSAKKENMETGLDIIIVVRLVAVNLNVGQT